MTVCLVVSLLSKGGPCRVHTDLLSTRPAASLTSLGGRLSTQERWAPFTTGATPHICSSWTLPFSLFPWLSFLCSFMTPECRLKPSMSVAFVIVWDSSPLTRCNPRDSCYSHRSWGIRLSHLSQVPLRKGQSSHSLRQARSCMQLLKTAIAPWIE